MTQTEKDMQELGLTPEQLKEREQAIIAIIADQSKPARAKRRDAGKPRKPAPEQPGASVWLSRLRDLMATRDSKRMVFEEARDHLDVCEAEYQAIDREMDAHLAAYPGK